MQKASQAARHAAGGTGNSGQGMKRTERGRQPAPEPSGSDNSSRRHDQPPGQFRIVRSGNQGTPMKAQWGHGVQGVLP